MTPRPTVPIVELRAVSHTYPGSPPVVALDDCHLRIDRGDWVSVQGPSGSGKSTLLNVLGLMDRPSSGRYILAGDDTSDLPERERTVLRARRLGFIFQSFHLLPRRTATENVVLALMYSRFPRRKRVRQAEEMLGSVGLGGLGDRLPSELSGGQQQRVAIARALAVEPDLLLCDEPTGNLDQRTSVEILGLLGRLHGEGRTLVLITHDPAAAASAGRRCTIVDGRLDERGQTGLDA